MPAATASAKSVTVRKQIIKKSYVKHIMIFFIILGVGLLVIAAFGDKFTPYDPDEQNYEVALQPPSFEHPLGTDRYGRDMFSRVIVGAKVSISATLALVAIITAFGTMVGVVCGFVGGKIDAVIMRFSDICLAFPGLVFAMAIAAVLKGGVQNAVLALACISWPKYARIARSQSLSMRRLDYINAARLAGSTTSKIIFTHILPNIIGPILVTAMLDIGTMMMELAGLSFLGLGAMPPTAEWGNMMSGGRSMLQSCPWVILAPGGAIFISVVIFNMLGDTVRDYVDPRNTQRN